MEKVVALRAKFCRAKHGLALLLHIAATMLDCFEILTTSGVVLWSKTYVPVSAGLVNHFIKDVFVEENVFPATSAADDSSATKNPSYRKDQYTLRWASVKDLGLIFVVRMPSQPILVKDGG